MIRYSLKCGNAHGFEGWFASSGDYDGQRDSKLVECPVCRSHDITKELMTPSVSTSRAKERRHQKAAGAGQTAVLQPEGHGSEKREMLQKMRELREKILAGSENVGNRFSEEARKIHFGEAQARGIHGLTSLEEAAELIDEGIEIMPVPDLPEERN